jgi:hypothetical protein
MLAGHLGVDGKHLDLVAAIGAGLFNNGGCTGFSLASFSNHNMHLLDFVI